LRSNHNICLLGFVLWKKEEGRRKKEEGRIGSSWVLVIKNSVEHTTAKFVVCFAFVSMFLVWQTGITGVGKIRQIVKNI
jgi:hypothetical protein